jgi:hypothetical protein
MGPFAIEERLGEALTTTVYRAVHIQQRRSVALKIFPAPLVAIDPRAKAALVQEIETLKQFSIRTLRAATVVFSKPHRDARVPVGRR